MSALKSTFHPLAAIIAAGFFAAMTAQADTTTYDTKPLRSAEPAQSSGPSANNDKYREIKTRCEKDVPSGKASGEACVEAAALLVADDLPDEFREMREDQRIKIALRLLERGVDSSNIARGRAYDYYDRVGFLGISAYADPYRANELMDLMEKSAYPGGYLRKARASVAILSITTGEAQKKEYCAGTKKLLDGGKLDADSLRIAREVMSTAACTPQTPVQ